MKSQNTMILCCLLSGKSITPMQALNEFGCFRLSARIKDLREKGHNIKTETVTTHTGKRVARYSL